MNEKTKRIYGIYLLGASLMALVITILRTLATVRELDVATGYLALGSGLHRAASILTLVSLVLCLSAAPVLAGRLRVKHRVPHLPTLFASAFVAFLLLAFAFFHLCEILSVLGDESTLIAVRNQTVISRSIAIVFSLSGASGFMIAASGAPELSARRTFSSCFVVLFCLIYTLFLYFEPSLPLNADVKLLAQGALLAAALFFLYDARITLGKPRWAFRTAIGLAAMLITASVSLPNLIYYLLRHESVLQTPVHDFLIFGFFLYISARMTSLCDLTPAPAEGFFGEALEMSRLSGAEQQISFFGADEVQDIDEVEAITEAEELLAPPTEPVPEETAEPLPAFDGEPEEIAEASEAVEAESEESDLLDLFGAPSEQTEEASEDDILTAGIATEEEHT